MEPPDSTRPDNLPATELQAILSNRAAADHPQPVDYGLTHDELAFSDTDTWRAGLKYKSGGLWFGESRRMAATFMGAAFVAGGVILIFSAGRLSSFGLVCLGLGMLCLACDSWMLRYNQNYTSSALSAYKEALRLHELYKVAMLEVERTKHSYWEHLNGYEFERATAEVLNRHRFNPKVTRGSADGGVDIEVTKGGRKGVVQCKAHAARVAPAIVRDLFGVMHHSNSDFGIIVSLGGFTKGAIEFAENKPIFLLDCSDLIAMQEGQDILAKNFPADSTP